MAKCSSRSPLVRSGTTQAGRDLAELAPDYFRVDERGLPDLVLYAQALSREIAYYGPDNQPAGDWEPFFAADVTATLAEKITETHASLDAASVPHAFRRGPRTGLPRRRAPSDT